MPHDEDHFLARIVDALATVPGVTAIVLGGSRASGTHTPQSDYDIGLYYDGATPSPSPPFVTSPPPSTTSDAPTS